MISVNVLLYGDYPALADRCLGSIVRSAAWNRIADLRVGLNEVSLATEQVIADYLRSASRYVKTYTYRPERNVGKYPLMRRMFKDAGLPSAKYTMWFDDDSYIVNDTPSWWSLVTETMENSDVIGDLWRWRPGFASSQLDGIRAQPWYGDKKIGVPNCPLFAQGGWWTIRTAILKRWDWPIKELHHNGGDTLLGELCYQQGYRLRKFMEGFCSNCDDKGERSKAKRRGMRSAVPFSVPYDPAIHDFACRIRCYLTLAREVLAHQEVASELPPISPLGVSR